MSPDAELLVRKLTEVRHCASALKLETKNISSHSALQNSPINSSAQNAAAFLHPPPGAPPASSIDLSSAEVEARIRGACSFDERLLQWSSKLVPRKVSENDFWHNYFAHVSAVFAAGEQPRTSSAEYQLQSAAVNAPVSVQSAALAPLPLPSSVAAAPAVSAPVAAVAPPRDAHAAIAELSQTASGSRVILFTVVVALCVCALT